MKSSVFAGTYQCNRLGARHSGSLRKGGRNFREGICSAMSHEIIGGASPFTKPQQKAIMKTLITSGPIVNESRTLALAMCAFIACSVPGLMAQAPVPAITPFATGLLAPSKIIGTPRGNFIVAEAGPEVPNHGRVSIVDAGGQRRTLLDAAGRCWTLLDGLPSARTFVGDFNGTTGVWLDGRTLYVLNGQGDVTLAGPVQGTEKANPAPASPIFSSVLAVHFSAAMEDSTTGIALTPADHALLKTGARLVRTDAGGQRAVIELVADFADYAPEPRPNFAAHVRHSHPYGVVGHSHFLYIVDAGFNVVRRLDLLSGTADTLASFAPTPNPRFPVGPPFIENVPTSIRWAGDQLQVTLLSGAPFFLPGYSRVQQVDPVTGVISPLITGLSSAIDTIPLGSRGQDEGDLTLEHNLTFPVAGAGRLQYFSAENGIPVILTQSLTTPTSMVLDPSGNHVIITEMATGRLVALELP